MTVNISPNAVNAVPLKKVYQFPASSAQRRLWFLDWSLVDLRVTCLRLCGFKGSLDVKS
jgi:hypothetical protein